MAVSIIVKCAVFVAALMAFIALIPENVNACSWVSQTACQSAARARTVFVGRVISSTEATRKITRRELPIGGEWEENVYEERRQISRMAVEEAFFGTSGQAEIVIETEFSSSCAVRLGEGETYLIYASQNKDEVNLMTHFCSGSKAFDSAEQDLAYLRANKEERAAIRGKVGFGEYWKLDPKPLGRFGVNTVSLTGGETPLEAKINADGSYSFQHVKAGTYNIRVVLPDSLITVSNYNADIADELEIGDESKIEVTERGCVIKNFVVRENGRISGQIADEKGDRIEGVTVYLIPVDRTGRRIPQEQPCYDDRLCLGTRENGKFLFTGLKAGNYLVGVRLDDYVCNDCIDAGYATTFFPGVSNQKLAGVVTVKTGSLTPDVNLKLVRKYTPREIRGRVLFKNGQAAPRVNVRYVARTPDFKDNGITFIKTDDRGNFSFNGYEDHYYLIGAFDLGEGGGSFWEAFAVTIKVDPGKKLAEVRLILDQDGTGGTCSKCGDYHEFPKRRTVPRRK